MSHLEEGLLHALLDGEIPSAELPPIQAHLAACLECRARLEEERQFRAEAHGLVELVEAPAPGSLERAVVSAEPAARVRRGRRWRDLAWAASLVAAVGLGYAAGGWNASSPAGSQSLPQSTVKVESVEKATPPPLVVSPAASGSADRAETRERRAGGPSRKLAAPALEQVKERSETSAVSPREEAKLADRAAGLAAPNALPTAPVATPAAPGPGGQGVRRDQPKPEPNRLDEVVVTSGARLVGRVKGLQSLASRPDTISFLDALSRLGGAMRLIEGLVPVRLEAQGVEVMVVYPVRGGELLLAQRRVDGRVQYRLIAPPDFPADSLERLRARVRE